MSLLRELPADDGRLVRYLLGLLSPDEAECLDEQSVVDGDVANRLLTVENDLVDAYVSGTLASELRLRFEVFYLASPRRRRRVTFARRLLAAVDRTSPTRATRRQQHRAASSCRGPRTSPRTAVTPAS
jgi:hypothetical protein